MTSTDQLPRWIEYVALDELRPHPDNPKAHDVEELRASIDRFDFTEPHLVDERTGLLISGHGRREVLLLLRDEGADPPDGVLSASTANGAWSVPVVRGWSSRDDAEAKAYLAAANQLTTRGGWDDRGLLTLLNDLSAGPGLVGTGFGGEDVERLTRLIDAIDWEAGEGTNPYDEWRGMPDYESTDRTAFRAILVNFASAADVTRFEEALGVSLPSKDRSMWYPAKEKLVAVDQQWVSEGG
jgi:hypothetical protein